MDRGRIGAIDISIRLGKVLRDEHPEMLPMWESGRTHKDISQRLKIIEHYSPRFGRLTLAVTKSGINRALNGYSGEYGEPYKGLILNPEYRKLVLKKHRRALGLRNKRLKKGINGLSTKDLRKYSHEGIRELGFFIWDNGELDFAYDLYLNPDNFYNDSGGHHGFPNYNLITQKVNDYNRLRGKPEIVRTRIGVKRAIKRIRASLQHQTS